MWLGASDIEKEGTFVWETSKTEVTFTSWSSGQPDDAGNVENCVHIFSVTAWNDLDCNFALSAMCEVIFHCN
jgi:hypothetical protein